MNENRENTANDAAAAHTGAKMNDAAAALAEEKTNEALNALLEGFADEEDDWFEADEAGSDDDDDWFEAGEAGPDGDGDDDDDVLILVAGPEGGEPTAADRSDQAGPDGKNGASDAGAGKTGKNADASADGAPGKNAAVRTDGAPGENADASADNMPGTPEKSAAETAPQTGEEPRYRVQLSGRAQEMSVSELIAAAQRGLEHDAMRAELNAAQQALPALRMVEQYAAANGMTAGQYLQLAERNIHRQAVERLTQKGVPEQTARELVDERMQLNAQLRAIAPMVQRMKAEEAREKAREPWLEMTRQYPDVTNLPDSVLESVRRGETPLAAMRAWELEQLRAKLSAQELQLSAQAATLKNRHTAPGSAAGAADTRRDPFLEALFGDD